MFGRFKESPYWKASIAMTAAGAVLIIFNNWIKELHFTAGFETLNKTLIPIYIGVILAFLLCPVYNKIVKFLYAKMFTGVQKEKTTLTGTEIIIEPEEESGIDPEEGRKILARAKACASVVCTLLVAGLISLLMYFFIPQIIESSMNLMETLPERLNALSEWLKSNIPMVPQLAEWVDNVANAGTTDIINWMREKILQGNVANIAGIISSGVITAVNYVANTVIGIIIMIYLLNYKERLFAICRKIIEATCSKKKKEALSEFVEIVNETFIGFIVGKILDSMIIGVLTFTVMTILGMPFAPMIGVIIGVSNMIPFFGPFIGAIPSLLILMLEDPGLALEFVIMVIIIQQIDGNIIDPKIVGEAVGISSFWVLISVLIGGGLFGFAGMALGVPVFAVIYRYVNKLTIRSLKKREKETQTTEYLTLKQFGIDKRHINLEKPKEKSNDGFLKSIIKRKKETSDDNNNRS